MAVTTKSKAAEGCICDQCGEAMNGGIWKVGMPVRHCNGSSMTWWAGRGEAHHWPSRHPVCWSCGGSLGCRKCSGIAAEILCKGLEGRKSHGGLGAVWGTIEAFLAHGPVTDLGQTVGDYPEAWARQYLKEQGVESWPG